MELIAIGLNYKTASLEIREKFSLTTKKEAEILNQIKASPLIKEGVIISTCNRTEIYLLADKSSLAKEFSFELFMELSKLEINDLKQYLYIYERLEAVKHLYQVVSGLDSLVIGETQILNQVKTAFKKAKRIGVVDTYLYQLFTESFRVAKRTRSETEINSKAASISYVAVELARKIFGNLRGETVLILGAGKMSELTLKSLVDHGVKGVMVANRTYQRGVKLAEAFAGEVIKWEQIEDWIGEVDIIIASTAAPHYVLHQKLIARVMKQRKRPLFLIDIAVPRDIEPEVKEIAGVHLYDIDDLELVVEKNLDARRDEIDQVQAIIESEISEFKCWLNYRESVPVIKEMRKKAQRIKKEELNWALKQTSDAKTEELLEQMANRLVNRLMHKPTIGVKEIADNGEELKELEVVKKLFDCRNLLSKGSCE